MLAFRFCPVLGNLQHQPLKVAPLANHRCVVLCGRELRVYDMTSGEEVLKLKGKNIDSFAAMSCASLISNAITRFLLFEKE